MPNKKTTSSYSGSSVNRKDIVTNDGVPSSSGSDETRASYTAQTSIGTKQKTTVKNTYLTLQDIGMHMTNKIVDKIKNDSDFGNENLIYTYLPEHERQAEAFNDLKGTDDEFDLGIDRRGFEKKEADISTLSLGEAKVMNIPFQFNELDDMRSNLDYRNIGRLYGERIYHYNLPIVLFQMGQLRTKLTPLILLSFTAQSNQMGEYLRSGSDSAIKWTAMQIKTAFRSIVGFLTANFLKTKHLYSFDPCPKVYYRYVNEILQELAVYMDLAQSPIESFNDSLAEDDPEKSDDSTTPEQAAANAAQENGDNSVTAALTKQRSVSDYDDLSQIDGMQVTKHYMGKIPQLHIYYMLPGVYHTGKRKTSKSVISTVESFFGDANTTAVEAQQQYIPFMIQKGVSISETFSNSTGEHPVMGEINSTSLQAQQDEMSKNFDTKMGINVANSAMNGDMAGAAGAALGQMAKNVIRDTLGHMGGQMGIIMSGRGRLQFPEVWNDSGYDRGYSISFKLFTPYGHRLAVYENIYIPYIMLLAMTLPRQVGGDAYISPFMVRAFCKGMFSCELGIVSSLSVAHGEDKNDRTAEGFPRSMTVNLTLKDLAPKLTLALDGGVFAILSAKNVGFKGYLTTLANMGIADRAAWGTRINELKNYLGGKYNRQNFGTYMRTMVGESFPFQIVAGIRKDFLGTTSAAARNNKSGTSQVF